VGAALSADRERLGIARPHYNRYLPPASSRTALYDPCSPKHALRSVATYLLVVFGFAAAYFLLGNNVSPALDLHGAIVFSLTSFHGRGFSPGGSLSPDNPLTTLAAVEAVIGLLIEITFIATFTQRFFAR
jgi:hypothetical protein